MIMPSLPAVSVGLTHGFVLCLLSLDAKHSTPEAFLCSLVHDHQQQGHQHDNSEPLWNDAVAEHACSAINKLNSIN